MCTYICIYVHTLKHTRACTHTPTHTHAYTRTQSHSHTHTYTLNFLPHTHTNKQMASRVLGAAAQLNKYKAKPGAMHRLGEILENESTPTYGIQRIALDKYSAAVPPHQSPNPTP